MHWFPLKQNINSMSSLKGRKENRNCFSVVCSFPSTEIALVCLHLTSK